MKVFVFDNECIGGFQECLKWRIKWCVFYKFIFLIMKSLKTYRHKSNFAGSQRRHVEDILHIWLIQSANNKLKFNFLWQMEDQEFWPLGRATSPARIGDYLVDWMSHWCRTSSTCSRRQMYFIPVQIPNLNFWCERYSVTKRRCDNEDMCIMWKMNFKTENVISGQTKRRIEFILLDSWSPRSI